MLPYLSILYSDQGIFQPNHNSNQITLWSLFIDSIRKPLFIDAIGRLQVALAAALILFNFTGPIAILYFLASYLLYMFNSTINTPDMAIVNLLLIATVIVYYSNTKHSVAPLVPNHVRTMVWFGLGASYLYAGLDKLTTYEWQVGHGLKTIIEFSPVSTDFGILMDNKYPWLSLIGNYLTLFLEIIYLPSLFFRKIRSTINFLLIFIWVVGLFYLHVQQYLWSAILAHLLLVNTDWLNAKNRNLMDA
jgi:hypothetical protein